MGDGVVSEAYALGEERPDEILRGRQISHGAVPKPPPCFNFTVGLWVVTAGGCAMRASDGGDSCHEFTQEFRSVIRVQDFRGATSKVEFVEKARYQGGGLAVGEADE